MAPVKKLIKPFVVHVVTVDGELMGSFEIEPMTIRSLTPHSFGMEVMSQLPGTFFIKEEDDVS